MKYYLGLLLFSVTFGITHAQATVQWTEIGFL